MTKQQSKDDVCIETLVYHAGWIGSDVYDSIIIIIQSRHTARDGEVQNSWTRCRVWSIGKFIMKLTNHLSSSSFWRWAFLICIVHLSPSSTYVSKFCLLAILIERKHTNLWLLYFKVLSWTDCDTPFSRLPAPAGAVSLNNLYWSCALGTRRFGRNHLYIDATRTLCYMLNVISG